MFSTFQTLKRWPGSLLKRLPYAFKVVYISPLFFGPLVVHPRVTSELFLTNYASFVLLITLWIALLMLASSFYAGRKTAAAGKVAKLKVPLLLMLTVICSALFLGGLQFFKGRFPAGVTYLILLSLAFSAGSAALRQRGKITPAILLFALWATLVSYLGFLMITNIFAAEPLSLSAGLGAMLGAARLAKALEFDSAALSLATNRKVLSRLYAALMLAGPVTMGSLCYIHALKRDYLAVFLTVPLIARLLAKMPEAGDGQAGTVPAGFTWRTEAVCFLFLLIITVLGFWPALKA